jgi:hypothetical protein
MKSTGEILQHVYECVKVNKCDRQYIISGLLPIHSELTNRVKIEAFQGYSKAYNLGEYFRLRGESSWKGGKQLTGLWKSETHEVHYGDRRTAKGKALMLFKFEQKRDILKVYTYPSGYYPSKATIESLCKAL